MQTHNLQSFAQRLKKEREKSGLTLNKLAEVTHLPASRIRDVENREAESSITELSLIARALGVSTDRFLERKSPVKMKKGMVKNAWGA